jgi:hypothetical protein
MHNYLMYANLVFNAIKYHKMPESSKWGLLFKKNVSSHFWLIIGHAINGIGLHITFFHDRGQGQRRSWLQERWQERKERPFEGEPGGKLWRWEACPPSMGGNL